MYKATLNMENNKKKTHEMKTHFILCLPTPGDTTDYDDQTAFVISLLRPFFSCICVIF